MKIRLMIAGACIATGMLAGIPAGSAQGIQMDQNGIRVVPPGYDNRDHGYRDNGYDNRDDVSARDARRIARNAGVVDTFDVGRRGPMWIVRGEDRRGRDLRVTISAHTGDIVNVERRS